MKENIFEFKLEIRYDMMSSGRGKRAFCVEEDQELEMRRI